MKRKFSIFLNVAVLALCVCAIAIGVYSAKQASLNVGGTVGFIAHNCKVELYGSIQACKTSEDTVRTTKTISTITIGGSESSYALNLDTAFGSAMQFSDMFDDGQTIIITLNIKNTSAFAIRAKANMPTITGSNISKTVKLGCNTITESTSTNLEIDGTTTLTITLTLNSTESSFATNALVSGTLFEFEKKPENVLISFTIGDTSYNAIEGMTFGEWCDSEYNVDNFYVVGTSIIKGSSGTGIDAYSKSSVIENGKVYRLDPIPEAQISFTIEKTQYVAGRGMTFGEWVNSSYNRRGFTVQGEEIAGVKGEKIDGVNINTVIADSGVYYLIA